MLTIVLTIALVWVAVKMLIWGLRAAWGIAKILCIAILLPLLIYWLAYIGLFYIAIPILVITGIISLIGKLVTA